MHPVLFKIGSVEFYTYGLMLGLGFVAGAYVASRRAEKKGMSADSLFWLFILLLVGGVVGGRIFHVALNLRNYHSILSIIDTREGGLAIHGVLIGGMVTAALYSHYKKIPFGLFMDILAPAAALGQSIGRIGCFFSGCCYGIETGGTWGIETRFAPGLRQPYQLYESAADLLLFLALLWLADRVQPSGRLFAIYVSAYSAIRFFLEFVRDNDSSYLAGLSYGQWASVIGVALGAILWTYFGKATPAANKITE